MKIKTAIDFINEWYPFVDIIVKDRGNRGYYVKYMAGYPCYTFISKKTIIRIISRSIGSGEQNERLKKLIELQIMNE